jgi:hypothetical protein
MRRYATLALATPLLLLALLTGATPSAEGSCEQVDPVTLLPGDQVCPGWMLDGEPLTAYNEEELTAIINGGAYLFLAYGFVAAAFQNYTGTVSGEPAVATLALFNQGTSQNADSLYHDPQSGWGDPIPGWPFGGEARVNFGLGNITFQFWEECFFGSIVLVTEGDDPVPEAQCLAEAVCLAIQAALPVEATTWGKIKTQFQ